jgi:photosystem II stability/assembly factor-like uncharacterized protein
VNVTNNVGGETWGPGGVCLVACVPGADVVIAGVTVSGLWSSADGGATWTLLGAEDSAKIANRPTGILFDPQNPKTFWESGNSGPGVFKTTDGGKTFVRLGTIANVDCVDVDFSDPDRKTLLATVHNQPRGLMKSTDGGRTWKSLAKGLPEKTHPVTCAAIIDSKTYLVSAYGTAMGRLSGIFRSEDGGETWTKVHVAGAAERPLVTSSGTIYWLLEGEGLSKSTDKGKTWSLVKGKPQRTPIEAVRGQLVSADGGQVYSSADRGATWEACAPPAPYVPTAVAYNSQRNCFYICRSADRKSPEAVARLDLAKKLESLVPRKLVIWNGEDATGGKAWAGTAPTTTLKIQGAEVHGGKSAMEFHAEGKTWVGFNWNWHGWWPKDAGTDLTDFTTWTFWAKFRGTKPANTQISVRLMSSGEKPNASANADLLKYCPDLFDGQWHEIVVPLDAIRAGAPDFNLKKAWEFQVLVSSPGDINFTLYVDDVTFDNR